MESVGASLFARSATVMREALFLSKQDSALLITRLNLEGDMAPLALGSMFDAVAHEDSKRSAEEVDEECRKKIKVELIAGYKRPESSNRQEGNDDNYANAHRRTREQLNILSYEPAVGEIVPNNAYAGCAKTTTNAMLRNKIAELTR
jgi:hypothetical protein